MFDSVRSDDEQDQLAIDAAGRILRCAMDDDKHGASVALLDGLDRFGCWFVPAAITVWVDVMIATVTGRRNLLGPIGFQMVIVDAECEGDVQHPWIDWLERFAYARGMRDIPGAMALIDAMPTHPAAYTEFVFGVLAAVAEGMRHQAQHIGTVDG